MYLDFYGLNKLPFHITPNPAFLFPSTSHREALASIIYGIEERKGFLAITGEVGVGKTTILRSYLEQTANDKIRVVYVFNPALSFKGLLKIICGELGIAADAEEEFELVSQIHFALIDLYAQDKTLVLIVDEAQNMPLETIEKLRMLSNLETSEDKLIQVILMGQPEFDRILDLKQLRQLKQRVAIRSTILPLTTQESLDYIHYRLKKAGAPKSVIFTDKAMNLIVREAKGIPRMINILCDNALITGFGLQQKPITRRIVQEVIRDFKGRNSSPANRRWLPASITALVFIVGAILSILYFKPQALRVQGSPSTPVHEASQPAADSKAPAVPSTEQQEPKRHPIVPMEREVIPAEQSAHPVGEISSDAGGGQPPAVEAATPDKTGNSPDRKLQPVSTEKVAAPENTIIEPSTQDARQEISQRRVTVKKGDITTNLIREMYGRVDDELIAAVKAQNPHIKNLSRIKPGDILRFPHNYAVLPKADE